MQDPSIAFQLIHPRFPEQEQLKCPRCESTNTKFCYYNNYNLSQPRHFCKSCKRYWTKGGALRNIPIGGGSRKNSKRPSNRKGENPGPNPDPDGSSRSTPTSTRGFELHQDRNFADMGGSFCPLMASSMRLGSMFDGLNRDGSDLKPVQMGGFSGDLNPRLNAGSGEDPNMDAAGININLDNGGSEDYLERGDWGSSNRWPELAIYTPGGSSIK